MSSENLNSCSMSAVKTIRPGGCSHAKNGEKDTDESGNKKQSESAECPDCDRSAEKRSDHIVCSVHLELPQSRRRKLILHLDLNNTILVSDAVTKQGTVAALDYFLSTATWGRVNRQGKIAIPQNISPFFFCWRSFACVLHLNVEYAGISKTVHEM